MPDRISPVFREKPRHARTIRLSDELKRRRSVLQESGNLLDFPKKADLLWPQPSKNRAFPDGRGFSMLNFQAGADTFPSSGFP